ncbi:hypothetical protein [Massilia antarctica]|uniref:hypothetical protein n=1 Tax=Massilia antarctica TaxID=2765360 RepID=UPI0022709C8F|nr:hypothetical protein [Massilia sp. H27-R4]MCY0910298.1 hypothetical protein [Massilia sp. H27-R4]
MTTATEKKQTITLDNKKAPAADAASPAVDAVVDIAPTPEKTSTENLREAIHALDAERTELVKKTIENIKPGKPFDSSVVRDINKLETRKNRLIVARLASLLKKSGPEVQAIVHQIIEL